MKAGHGGRGGPAHEPLRPGTVSAGTFTIDASFAGTWNQNCWNFALTPVSDRWQTERWRLTHRNSCDRKKIDRRIAGVDDMIRGRESAAAMRRMTKVRERYVCMAAYLAGCAENWSEIGTSLPTNAHDTKCRQISKMHAQINDPQAPSIFGSERQKRWTAATFGAQGGNLMTNRAEMSGRRGILDRQNKQ